MAAYKVWYSNGGFIPVSAESEQEAKKKADKKYRKNGGYLTAIRAEKVK